MRAKSCIIDDAFSRRFFVLGQPAVEEEWTRDGVMRESNQFRDIILVGNKIYLFNVKYYEKY
jgi:hypothetical protein